MTGTLRALVILAAAAMADPRRAPAADAAEPPDQEIHVVKRGDTLSTIAAATLGKGALWPALYRANRDQIKDPARLYPGQKLTIPGAAAAEGSAPAQIGEREPADPTPR